MEENSFRRRTEIEPRGIQHKTGAENEPVIVINSESMLCIKVMSQLGSKSRCFAFLGNICRVISYYLCKALEVC